MALAEIADFVVNVCHLLHYLLKISIFIGKVLVELIRNGSYVVWKILEAIGRFAVVFYEDYSYFIEDFKRALSSIAIFVIECLTSICGGVVRAVVSTRDAVVAGYHGIGELVSGRLLTVPIFTFEFLKQLLVLVGDGVWFLATLPGRLAINGWECFQEGLAIVGHFSRDVGSKSLDVVTRLGYFLVKDVPLQSACGILILILAYMNPRWTERVLKLCFGILRFLYRKLLPYGRGIRRKYLQFKQTIAQAVNNILITVLRGFLYLRDRGIYIYDTEVRRIVTYIRNFFSFSDRHHVQRDPPYNRAHHFSRIEHRQNHSGSEQSSRSSSASSDQSNRSTRSQLVRQSLFAQTTSASNRNSPSKNRPDDPAGTNIGLCIICEDNEKSVVLVPCGHLCLCKRCADQLGNYDRYCPICRTLIYRKVDVYI